MGEPVAAILPAVGNYLASCRHGDTDKTDRKTDRLTDKGKFGEQALGIVHNHLITNLGASKHAWGWIFWLVCLDEGVCVHE